MTESRFVQGVHIRQYVFSSLNPWRIDTVVPASAWKKFRTALTNAPKILDQRVLWNVNSTAAGGGVAEMLSSLLPYCRGAGLDVRWMVILGEAPFFEVTKRLHNFLHGNPGDGKEMGSNEKKIYEETLRRSTEEFMPLVQQGDIVFLHDPQTAGMIPKLKKRGAVIIWRNHIGTDFSNDYVEKGWEFLKPYLVQADAFVFTRKNFVPPFLQDAKTEIITPSIDPFSPKNQEMSEETSHAILNHVGLIKTLIPQEVKKRIFFRHDGSPERVDRWCDVLRVGPPPDTSVPLFVQISRWDRLKDPIGVMKGFSQYVAPHTEAHLVLAGPAVQFVADDPEGNTVLAEVETTWRHLPIETRSRIALVCIPMRDLEENAAIVNALQRQATVVIQKSIQEGFGLTVTEAMWKGPVVVASSVGGIQDQIKHEESGYLLKDPTDLEEFGKTLLNTLDNKGKHEAIGEKARKTVIDRFLFNRQLEQYFSLISELLNSSSESQM